MAEAIEAACKAGELAQEPRPFKLPSVALAGQIEWSGEQWAAARRSQAIVCAEVPRDGNCRSCGGARPKFGDRAYMVPT